MWQGVGSDDRVRIYTGSHYASWDENGWVWYMARRGSAYCAVRITPLEYAKLREDAVDFTEFIARLEARATTSAPHPDEAYGELYSIGEQPRADPSEINLEWLATLYFVDPTAGSAATSQWQASGPARAMVAMAMGWGASRFRGAYLMGNAGLLYKPDQIREIARLHTIGPIDSAHR